MTFFTAFIIAMLIVLVLGFAMEWFQNKKGSREINARGALVIIGLAVIPVANFVFAIGAIIFFTVFILDMVAYDALDRFSRKILLSDAEDAN